MGLGGRRRCQNPSGQARNAYGTLLSTPPLTPKERQQDTRLQIASVTCSLLSAMGSILMGDQGPQEQYYIEKVAGRGSERSGLSEPST